MRRSSAAGTISIPLITSTSTYTYDTSTQGARGRVYLGNVFEDPDLADRFGIDLEPDLEGEDPEGEDPEGEDPEGEDYGAHLGYRGGRSGLNGYVNMPTAMQARPRRQSWAAAARMAGDPDVFLSSPGAGALFIDTDGLRVQHGDDS